jgi:hypothetical protein
MIMIDRPTDDATTPHLPNKSNLYPTHTLSLTTKTDLRNSSRLSLLIRKNNEGGEHSSGRRGLLIEFYA